MRQALKRNGRSSMPRSDRIEAEDSVLMRRVAAGDLAALGTLYDCYHEDVQQFVVRATAGAGDSEDLVHEVFLTVVSIAGNYDGRPCARPFLIGIAAQLVRRRRREFARVARALEMLASTVKRFVVRNPEDVASDAEELAVFESALEHLSEEKRLVFLMIETEALSGEDVARALGIPVATVWTRLHYARSELRHALLKRRKS